MKKILIAAVAASAMAAPAFAWEGKTVACFDKHWMGPKYSTHKVLVKPAKQQYEHKKGRIELVHYAPVYREVRTKVSDGYWVMKEVPCGCDC